MLGVNNCQPLLHMSKRLFYIYTTDKQINQFAIGYMINPTLQVNTVFREQVKKCLRATFHPSIMEDMRNFMIKKDTCVIALTIFNDSKKKSNKSV